MRRLGSIAASVALLLSCGAPSDLRVPAPTTAHPRPEADLATPDAFANIQDKSERSRALFIEASRVLLHPRCKNCHPAGDSPLQGDLSTRHDPPVLRGPRDRGVVGLECTSCHQDKNVELARVPGAPEWHVAPLTMAWEGKSLRAMCEQIKDPARNGGRALPALLEHAAHDPLVAWGWDPGHGRTRAPGTQARFAALISAWIDTGAECPKSDRVLVRGDEETTR